MKIRNIFLIALCLVSMEASNIKESIKKQKVKDSFNNKFEEITSKKLEAIEEKLKKIDSNPNTKQTQIINTTISNKIEKIPSYIGTYSINYKGKKIQKVHIKDSNNQAFVVPGNSIVKKVGKNTITLVNNKSIPLSINADASDSSSFSTNSKRISINNNRVTYTKPKPTKTVQQAVDKKELPSFKQAIKKAKELL